MAYKRTEVAIEKIIASCDGNMRGALEALMLVNEHLEEELQRLYTIMSLGDEGEEYRLTKHWCIEKPWFLDFRPVEPHRVTHEQLLLKLGGGRDVRNEVDQQAVVRHVTLQIGVGPVRAPKDAVGEGLDQGSWQRV